VFSDEHAYRAFVETVVFRLHLARLPPQQRQLFLDEIVERVGSVAERFHPRLRALEPARTPALMESALNRLQSLLGTRVTDNATVRDHHSRGESYHLAAAPDIVCFPTTTDEVASVVRIAAEFSLPIVPFGAGSSLEGHVHAIRGGISVDLRQMNRVVARQPGGSRCHRRSRRHAAATGQGLRNTGLMFPIDPGADATIAA
jgi:D-lactate dehydrogenase (cytochrome)